MSSREEEEKKREDDDSEKARRGMNKRGFGEGWISRPPHSPWSASSSPFQLGGKRKKKTDKKRSERLTRRPKKEDSISRKRTPSQKRRRIIPATLCFSSTLFSLEETPLSSQKPEGNFSLSLSATPEIFPFLSVLFSLFCLLRLLFFCFFRSPPLPLLS